MLDDSAYYVQLCIDIGNNRVSQIRNQNSRYFPKKCNIDPIKIVALDGDVPNSYLVPSERIEGKMYEVNMDLDLCECSSGMLRGPCKYKQIVATHFNLISSDLIPEQDPGVRAFYLYLATGKQQNANWYRPLTQQDAIEEQPLSCADIFRFMRNPDILQKITSREAGILSDEEMNDNVMEVENREEENEVDTTIRNFEVAMDDFKKEVLKRICEDAHSYTKCVKSFTKQLRSITHSHRSIFQKTLFSFVNDDITSTRKGRKKVREQFQYKRLQNHGDFINVEVDKVPGKADLQKI